MYWPGKASLKEFCTWCSPCLLAPSRVSQNKIIGPWAKHCRFTAPFSPQRNTSEKSRCNTRIEVCFRFSFGDFSGAPAVHFARVYTSKTLSFVTLSAAKAVPTGNDVLCYLAVGMVGLVFGEGVHGYRLPKTNIFIHFCTWKWAETPKGKVCFLIIHFQVLLLLVSGRVNGRIYRTMSDFGPLGVPLRVNSGKWKLCKGRKKSCTSW